MRVRGKAIEIKAFYPDGRSETLLNVPNYSFAWQTFYYFKQPPAIPKGTRLLITGYKVKIGVRLRNRSGRCLDKYKTTKTRRARREKYSVSRLGVQKRYC